jgi:membrane-associated phospholipid phosphatase
MIRLSEVALLLLLAIPSAQARQSSEETNRSQTVQTSPAAQQRATRLSAQRPEQVSERALLKNIWSDQKHIWSAPLRRESYRSPFLLPFAAGTAALIATDKQTGRALSEGAPGTGFDASNVISHLGSAEAVIGFTGAYYGFARLVHSDRARKTGLIAGEALADSGIIAGILKAATQRERPAQPNGQRIDDARGRFWAGGGDFPSGHAISVWTLAAVFGERYPDRPAVRCAAYGLAGLVSVSRLTARQHFPSDVLVGSVLGYLIGRYVVHSHR